MIAKIKIIIIIIKVLIALISLTLSRYSSLCPPLLTDLASIQWPHGSDEYKSLPVGQYRCVQVLQQYPTCFVRLTWMVCKMGGQWLYSFSFVGFQDLLKTGHSMRINSFIFIANFLSSSWQIFCVVSSFTTFRLNFTSGLLQVIYRDLG